MMTQNQRNAFGFIGTNPVWDEVLKVIQQTQESLWMHAISAQQKGEDRVHACGQADGANMIYSLLISLRQEARKLNGLTEEEDLVKGQ
jgi:hypothetical protein